MHRPSFHPAGLEIERLLGDCDVRRTRRGGPGGQHRNKVETAVVITHRPTGVAAEASERRSQEANRRRALFRLRVNLALQVRLSRKPDAPASELWRSRCRDRRISISAKSADFPALLAEALDALGAQAMDLPATAASLDCTGSQLIRLLKCEPRALGQVNVWREEHGLHPLQ